jgi:tetratricopeptide (TPR) repeat protein
MRRIILVSVGIVFSLVAMSQSREMAKGDSIPWELRKQSFIYNTAKLFNDPVVARTALYNLLAENPGNQALYDSLSMLYIQYNQNASAALVAQQSLQINPKNTFALEIAATGFDNLGIKDRAINYYEKLYLASNDINTLYKISFLQFEIKSYGEANATLDIIIGNPESESVAIGFPTTDGAGQDVPLRVAAYRVKAMIEEEKGNKEVAMSKYLEVLNMYPGFQIVQQQIQEMKKNSSK